MTAHPNCELPGSSEFFMPELNLWRADAAHRTTIVCAGGASNDKPGAGRFLIIRSSAGARESVDQVTVPGVGPVKITKAPRGPHAATRGQTHGNIEFRAHDGSTGTLHLEDDTVTVDPKSNRLTADSTCDEIPAGHVSKAMVKKWLLKLSVVRAVERMQNGWVARNVGDLQAYCQSHPAAGLDHATAVILHSDPAR